MIAFARYLVSAGAASLVDFVIVQALLLLPALQAGLPFALAIVAGALAGMTVNFLLSRRFVFQAADGVLRRQVQRFVLISLSTLLLRIVVAFAFVALFGLPIFAFIAGLPIDAPATRLASILAMGLVTLYSYFAHKHISFAGSLGLARRLPVR